MDGKTILLIVIAMFLTVMLGVWFLIPFIIAFAYAYNKNKSNTDD